MKGDHDSARKRGSSWEISGISAFFSYRARNWRIIKERGEGKTYPPYFNTVISGIATPNGRLLLVNFST
jgi:hypothetical protein